jgi:hypothetical protein
MQYQETRSMAYLASTVVASALYALCIQITYPNQVTQASDDRVFWAAVILIFVPVLIIFRIVVSIIFAIMHKIRTDEDTVYQEDELDRLIGLKATRMFYNVFMVGVGLALLGQVLGLPLHGFFLMLGGAIVVAGLTLDLTQLFFYRRGI